MDFKYLYFLLDVITSNLLQKNLNNLNCILIFCMLNENKNKNKKI